MLYLLAYDPGQSAQCTAGSKNYEKITQKKDIEFGFWKLQGI